MKISNIKLQGRNSFIMDLTRTEAHYHGTSQCHVNRSIPACSGSGLDNLANVIENINFNVHVHVFICVGACVYIHVLCLRPGDH